MQGGNHSLATRLLTEVPDTLHLKLWSWVILSYGIILPVINSVLELDVDGGEEDAFDVSDF